MKEISPMKKNDDYKEETDKLKSEANKNKES
jgi:hypothetical protein